MTTPLWRRVDLTAAVDRGQLVGVPPVRGGHERYQQLQ
jgi:hypothetical protein